MLRKVDPTLLQQLDRVLRVNIIIEGELKVELPGGTVLGAVPLGVGKGKTELNDLRRRRREGGREGGITSLVVL